MRNLAISTCPPSTASCSGVHRRSCARACGAAREPLQRQRRMNAPGLRNRRCSAPLRSAHQALRARVCTAVQQQARQRQPVVRRGHMQQRSAPLQRKAQAERGALVQSNATARPQAPQRASTVVVQAGSLPSQARGASLVRAATHASLTRLRRPRRRLRLPRAVQVRHALRRPRAGQGAPRRATLRRCAALRTTAGGADAALRSRLLSCCAQMAEEESTTSGGIVLPRHAPRCGGARFLRARAAKH